jgi:hypothetical protein
VDNEQVVTFVDNARPAPLTGSRTDSYMCAALDVFGRWSPWVAATHLMAQDPPPLPPQILKASFTTQDKKAVPGRIVFATIEVELAWDWEDRSPADWRLVGGFFDPAGAPPAAAPTSFHTTQGTSGMQDPVKIVLFSPDNVSAPGSGGQFVPLPVKATDGEVRRYKFTRPFFELDFGAAAKLAYAVYAQSNHKVDPTRFGPFSAPVVARVNDPLPAAPPAVQPAINWTALPDATGVARARLTFGGDASHASGYVVYEASETAIRAATGLGPPPKTGQGSTISARADVLKQIAGTTKAMDTFARVHPQLLPVPAVEVTLPAAVDGLYAYTFTSVTAEQVESARSAVTLVAVPRQITPGAPGLRVRPEEGRVRIRVVPGPGAPPAGVALHRVASPALASALDLMGPPLFDRDAPAWHKDADGTFTLLDPVPASWRPYFYRAVAYGKDEPAAGRRAGRSAPSAVMDVQVPPVASPDLTAPVVSKATNPALLRVQVRSGADIRVSPLGVHRLRLATANRSGPVPKEELQAEAILPTAPPRAQPPVEALHQLTRGDRDGAGRYLYEGYVPLSDADVLVRLADPLGRVSTQRAVLAPDLLGLLASASGSSLTVSVRSAAPVTPPPSGAFLLELFQEGLKGLVLLCQAQLHTIGTAPLPGQFVRSGPLPDGRFIYAITLPVTVTSGSGSLRVVAGPEGPPGSVQMRLTAPLGFQRELTANVVFGGEEA